MESIFTFLERRVDDCSSLLCIGLDPHVKDLPAPTAVSARDYCLNLVKQTSRYAAAFKPNAAFFEVFGAEGWTALKEVIEGIKEESRRHGSLIPIILDAKRGDIASTAEAYAKSAFETLGVDIITLNPYLGRDSIEPFLQHAEKGVFLLCKTSNPGSGDLQDLMVTMDDGPLTMEATPSSVHRPPSTVLSTSMLPDSLNPGTPKGISAWSSVQRMWMPCCASVPPRPICGSWLPASAPRAVNWNLP